MPLLTTLWQLLDISYAATVDTVTVTVTTDFPGHLFLRSSLIQPKIHPKTETRRGLSLMTDRYYCFDVYEDDEQEEEGDTTEHTWIIPDWPVCQTRFFYFGGTRNGSYSPSESCILKHHHEPSEFGPPVTVKFYSDIDPETSSIDGYCGHILSGSTWNFLRNAVGNYANANLSTNRMATLASAPGGGWWYLHRKILLYDTTSIPADADIISAKISLKPERLWTILGSSPAFNIFSSNPANINALIGPDYSTVGSLRFSTDVPYAALTVGVFTDYLFNAAGRAAIAKAGISKFSLREVTYDLTNIAPPWDDTPAHIWYFSYSSSAVAANKPYLEVTYREPA